MKLNPKTQKDLVEDLTMECLKMIKPKSIKDKLFLKSRLNHRINTTIKKFFKNNIVIYKD